MPKKDNNYKLDLPKEPNEQGNASQEENSPPRGWLIKCIISIIGVCGVMFILQFMANQMPG